MGLVVMRSRGRLGTSRRMEMLKVGPSWGPRPGPPCPSQLGPRPNRLPIHRKVYRMDHRHPPVRRVLELHLHRQRN
uniref:La-related protein 1C-like isoform X1 n=1 Tax=Rhizophora mucronata TaxID=61149 RepID=A0A2P2LBA3_RHIMU